MPWHHASVVLLLLLSGVVSAAAMCGNAMLDGTEECDDNNQVDGDGCSSMCTLEPGWTCDQYPPPQSTTMCGSTCGDGMIALGAEECDDGNNALGDGCSDLCLIEDGWWCEGH